MKNISREAIQRMTGGVNSIIGGGAGGGGDLAGYATEMWVEDKYVNKDFFSSLFKAYDANGNEVLPNDTETVIDNIKAMFGFWTDFYISALGTGGQQSVGLRLAQLADVNVAGVTNGQVLTYDSTTGKWIASTPQAGTDMATVWANLATSGNQQINYTHISNAVKISNGTITIGSSSITPITSHQSLAGYAKEQWVGQNYLPLAGGTINGNLNVTGTLSVASKLVATQEWVGQNYISIAYFDRLFRAYNGSTLVSHNDTSSTIDNIKAMFGFWTDFYISALGTGGQSTVGLRLAQLADVNVAGVQNGQVLAYDTASGKWIASTPQSGTDMATVWANLAASGNQQINYSHLSGAISLSNGTITIGSSSITPITSHQSLAGYATQQWVTSQGYLTPSAISDMATQTWVNNKISDMATKTWANGQFLPLSGGTVTGTLVLSKTQDASGSADNGPALVVGGNRSQAHIEIDANEIIAKSGATGVTTLNLNDNGGPIWVAGDIQMTNNARIYNYAQGSNGSLYIGRPDDAGWVKISDMCSRQGDSYWKIYSNGNSEFANVYSRGYVTALSDARHKNVQGDIALTVEMVAKAPAVKFTWKDEKKPGMFVGSLAQYWQKILPEVVQSQADDTLSLDYQVAALISSIAVARKVVKHESRLQRLERMFAINEDDIED